MKRTNTERAMAATPPDRFGRVAAAVDRDAFRRKMNAEMTAFLRSLPASVHTDAVLCFAKHFHTPLVPEFDFFRRYYTPAWSILHWLEQMPLQIPALSSEDRRKARTAHAMALFLHPLDDHLDDGQLPASHLLLLLRSQAWLRMQAALQGLAADVPGGAARVEHLIGTYYACIGSPPAVPTLEGYCAHFRAQMATWMCVPTLMAAKRNAGPDFAEALQSTYGAFGTAWRLLDDLCDISQDMRSGAHSAVYYLLPDDMKPCWGHADSRGETGCLWRTIRQTGIRECLQHRIFTELTQAAETGQRIGLDGWSAELRDLAQPFGGTALSHGR